MNESNFWIRFVLAVLATWRVTHLLASEDGPADLIVRFRALLGQGIAGKLMDCFYCLSLWIAAPAALFVSHEPLGWMFSWLGISGAACLIERRGHGHAEGNAVWPTPQGDIDYVLRTETPGTTEEHRATNDAEHVVHWPDGTPSPADTHHRTGVEHAIQRIDRN
jgi:hypothetical protein